MPDTAVLILAAGKGTRMKSRLPKVLHEAGGRSLLAHVLSAAMQAGGRAEHTFVIAGYGADQIRAAVEPLGARVILQEPQLGTGHAVQVAAAFLRGYERVVVLHGDMPLVSAETVRGLLATQQEQSADAVLATAIPASPRAYGRILRDSERVLGIVEERQATDEQKRIRELNAGFYCFRVASLLPALERLGTDNPHREYYLTDTIAILAQAGKRVRAFQIADAVEILGINDRVELSQVDRELRRRKVHELMESGVTVFYPESVIVDAEVEVAADTVIEAAAQLLGKTRVGSECRIGSHAILHDCVLGDGVVVNPMCYIESAHVRQGARVGPFSRLREGAVIENGAHIGNFVEVKKSHIGRGSKAMHLAYIGDSEVGENVNVGAGTITCNYDGSRKHKTIVGDGAFIGSNSTLVAPVEVGSGAYIGAGSVITDPVPADALGLGRSRQTNKEGWARSRRLAQQATGAPASKS